MSKERDIDDILNSLNQLLREGESHNDDHVEEEVSIEEIEAELVELKEESAEPKTESDEPIAEEASVEPEADSEPEADPESEAEADSDEGWEQDEPVEAPISMQRVVLTEDMMVNNPQGSLLSAVPNHLSHSDEAGEPGTHESDEAELEQDEEQPDQHEAVEERPHTLLHVDHKHLEQILERVADDVIEQLQHELPHLIKRSLYHHLAEMRDAGRAETDSDKNSEE